LTPTWASTGSSTDLDEQPGLAATSNANASIAIS